LGLLIFLLEQGRGLVDRGNVENSMRLNDEIEAGFQKHEKQLPGHTRVPFNRATVVEVAPGQGQGNPVQL
jgi:hypothetical protein